jgi:hypothetical protein
MSSIADLVLRGFLPREYIPTRLSVRYPGCGAVYGVYEGEDGNGPLGT